MEFMLVYSYACVKRPPGQKELWGPFFHFTGQVSAQALPRKGEAFLLCIRDKGTQESVEVKAVQHHLREEGKISHSVIIQSISDMTDRPEWTFELDAEWVKQDLIPLMEEQGLIFLRPETAGST